jgi:hypothetical protein
LQIARLRARGKNKQADKLQGDKNEAARAAEFQAAGIPEKEARRMAAQERRDKDDAQYLARTGHRKMRGATNAGSYAGLDSMKSRGMSDEWNFDKLDAAKKDQRRPLKSQLDREAGKPSITPDAFSGKSIAEADKLLPVLKAIQAAVEKSVPAAADKLKPR